MYKIVIVDDEMIVRHAVKSLIRWEDFEYAGAAANGISALDLVSKTGADIVITDIKMPEMDGLELIKQLKANGFEGEVLVLSNYNDFDLVREALKCGAYDYMLKLTLKTESFMQTLEEMSVKLDGKQTKSGTPREGSSSNERKEDIPNILRVMDSRPSSSSLWQDEGLLEAGNDIYSFIIRIQEDEELGTRQANALQDTMDKLADGLFPGSQWTYVIRTDPRRFLLVTAFSPNISSAIPEELARRMINLASMYYSVQISVIYASIANDEMTLATEMSLSRQAEGMLFYSQPRMGCWSNQEITNEGDEEFWLAETKLRESFRKPDSGEIDLWTETALCLVEIAASRRIHPRVLKRALSGVIWSMADAEKLRSRYGWDEKPWLEKIETADTDSQLKEFIRNLAEEIAELAESISPLHTTREEVRQAMQYLEQHYPERVAISEVAAHVSLSEPYLCQVFKAETGQSILTYLNEIRMVKAYEMLSTSKYLVKQVAIEVGIPDPFYFNRLFKRRYGIAPKNVKLMS